MLQQTLGPLRRWSRDGKAVLCEFADAKLRISSPLPGVVRVWLWRSIFAGGPEEPPKPETVRVEDELAFKVSGPKTGPLIIRTGNLALTIDGATMNVVTPRAKVGLTPRWDLWRVGVTGTLYGGEHIYGLGEPDQHAEQVGLDRRGGFYEVSNCHQPPPSRLVLPVFYSSHGYGVYVDNSWTGRFDMGANDRNYWTYEADGGNLDLYLFTGSLPEMVEQFTRMTGRPALPPRWTMGFMQSKFGYKTRAELEAVAQQFRSRQIPCDGLVLDLYWFKRMGDLRFDEDAFPEPEVMVQGLKAQGFKLITIEEPYVAVDSRLCPEGLEQGYFCRFPGGNVRFPHWSSDQGAALADFTNPAVQEWWTQQHQELIRTGIAGWWLDLNEPEQVYPDMLPYGGPVAATHNTYALKMMESVAVAQERYSPGTRCFMMSRSGWVGMATLGGTTWSGDVYSNFESLANQPALGLGLGLCGVPGWNSDIGGFRGGFPSPELYIRWMQFGAFTPTMRPHGSLQVREPWQFGTEAERISRYYIQLRQRLMPYAYTALAEAHRTGAPLMRPLIWASPDDPNVADVADQYLYGPDLLVAPVMSRGAVSRQVYLPAGTWYDFEDRTPIAGAQMLTVNAPLERLPLFVRAGAVIPMAPLTQFDDGQPYAELTLTIWPAETPSSYELYEDDGATTGYRNGVIALTRVEVGANAATIAVSQPKGPYAAELPTRRYRLEVIRREEPAAVRAAGKPLARIAVPAQLDALESGWCFDPKHSTLYVKLAPGRRGVRVEVEG